MPTETHADEMPFIDMTLGIAQTIQELRAVPSGHLYAQVMDNMSLTIYEQIISLLKKHSLVREVANLLIWIGPTV